MDGKRDLVVFGFLEKYNEDYDEDLKVKIFFELYYDFVDFDYDLYFFVSLDGGF